MIPFPRLHPNNAAVIDLKGWLVGQREAARNTLETADDHSLILKTQGRLGLIREMLKSVDPNHRGYGQAD